MLDDITLQISQVSMISFDNHARHCILFASQLKKKCSQGKRNDLLYFGRKCSVWEYVQKMVPKVSNGYFRSFRSTSFGSIKKSWRRGIGSVVVRESLSNTKGACCTIGCHSTSDFPSVTEAGKNSESWSLGPTRAQPRKQSKMLRYSSLPAVKI